MLGNLVAYRGFVLGSVKRELQSRYSNSLLGALWPLLNPLAMITVYALVFSQLMRTRLPGVDNHLAYGFYLCAGFLVWGLFSEVIGRSQTMFLDNANLIKKLSFPRICIPAVVVLSAVVNFAISFFVFMAFMLITGDFPGVRIIIIPLLLAAVLVFAIGLGMILGVLNVFFRDVGQLFGIIMQFWFWLTPIVYPVSILPDAIRPLVELNPITPLIVAFQQVLVFKMWPDWPTLVYPTVIGVALCLLGLRLFRQRSGEMVDEL